MAKAEKCMIIGAAPVEDSAVFDEFDPKEYFIICADGGYDTAVKYNIVPDCIIGDFDSTKYEIPETTNVIKLPAEKDATDTMYAAYVGMKLGYREFLMVGCLGGERFDHTYANYNVMYYISQNSGNAIMADSKSKVFMLKGRKLTLSDMKGYTVSVFPFGNSNCTVTYEGLKYPMNADTLTTGELLSGISNEIIENKASVKVSAGCALVIVMK